MPAKQYRIKLTEEERKALKSLVNTGKGSASRLRRARIVLMADEEQAGGGFKDADIAKALGAHPRTVERLRETCVLKGLEAALNQTTAKRSRSKTLDGAAEARLVQLACSTPPDGQAQWTMQMLADKLIELEIVETVSRETVRTRLKKTNSSRG